jgi:trigger factor
MLEQVRPQAIERIQARLVLEAVAEAEKITVSDDDFDAELAKMAEQYKMDADKLKGLMGDAELKTMREDITVQKAADFLVENVKEGAKKAAAKKTTTKKAAEDTAEEKPAKKTTTRKTTKKAAEDTAEEKPKRTTRKKKTEEEA